MNKDDIQQIEERGLSSEDISGQVALIKEGKNYLVLLEPATVKNGRIVKISSGDFDELCEASKKISSNAIKFVPASGAASRMFKALNHVYSKRYKKLADAEADPDAKDFITFWNNLESFPFYEELKTLLSSKGVKIADGNINDVLKYLLTEEGMNYAGKPKLLLTFHLDDGRPCLAMEEHVKEAVWLTGGKVHFTVTEAHMPEAKKLASALIEKYKKFGVSIAFSIQDPSTDVVALNMGDDDLHRNEDGSIFFRQSGHGALSKNLDEIRSPYIMIQNVDNLPGGSDEILNWKRAFMGCFARLEEEVFGWAKKLSDEKLDGAALKDAYEFITGTLKRPIKADCNREDLLAEINRPLVVAAMVPNKGEPGGGPFAVDEDGLGVNQIVEGAQQDSSDPSQKTIIAGSTHFNPVFLMVGTRDAWGKKFDLRKYAKREKGYVFYVEKADSRGEPFRSIDTGLWNGEIADMTIVFVEMPVETFGPAKTVLDLSPKIRPFRANTSYPEIL